MLNPDEIKRLAGEDFERTWLSTAKLLPRKTKISLEGKGKSHPVRDMIQRSREILLALGFDEVENKSILPTQDVYKEYGPEAPVILDRVFFLSKLPRPDIGLSDEKITQVEEIIGQFDREVLKKFLRAFKRGEIEGDDFVEELTKRLGIDEVKATLLLEKVFLEFRDLKPATTNQTLRSHMSATWYHTLAALQDKHPFPVALFAVGPRYRNEQREDHAHLRVHHSASIVIMDPEMSLEAGREITHTILKKYGFEAVRFEAKLATSKYYAPGQEEEVFARHKGKWFEIADIGMYSPISLANFGIKYPVFNAGFGVERLVMVLNKIRDIRELAYPQFAAKSFSDEEIANSLSFIEAPTSERGWEMARQIEGTARENKNEIAPCSLLAWEDDEIEVRIVEEEEGKRLIGPAGFNEICVKDGMIYSDTSASGTYTGMSYMQTIAVAAAARAEKMIEGMAYQVKMARSLSDINLEVPTLIREYIEGRHLEFKIGGPVFVRIEAHLKK